MWETCLSYINQQRLFFNSNKNCNFHFIVHTHSVVHDDDMRDDNQGISFIDVTYIGIPVCTITTYEDYSAAVLNSVLFSLFSVVLFSLSTHDTIQHYLILFDTDKNNLFAIWDHN